MGTNQARPRRLPTIPTSGTYCDERGCFPVREDIGPPPYNDRPFGPINRSRGQEFGPPCESSCGPNCGPRCGPRCGPDCGPCSCPECRPGCGPRCGPDCGPCSCPECRPGCGPRCGPDCGPCSCPECRPRCGPDCGPCCCSECRPGCSPCCCALRCTPIFNVDFFPNFSPTCEPLNIPLVDPTFLTLDAFNSFPNQPLVPTCQPVYQPISQPVCQTVCTTTCAPPFE